jgi:hypothetical protein
MRDERGEQKDARVLDLAHDHVGRDLERNVTREQDGDASLVLGEREPEVLLDPGELGCGDVLTVEVVEDVEEDHDGLRRSDGQGVAEISERSSEQG